MEIIRTTNRKARKDHVCNLCNLTIPKGTTYEHQVNKIDEIYTWKSHLECVRLSEKLNMYDGDYYNDGLTSDSFREIIWDYLKDNINIELWEDISWKQAHELAKEMLLSEKEDTK